jgi:hypothetical protein
MIKYGKSGCRENLRQIKAQKRSNTLCIASFCNAELANDLPAYAADVLISVYLRGRWHSASHASRMTDEVERYDPT